ncbi:DEAD/DEAH box helicase [Halomontanus rarus]|uniref:DEAD/DEAH box helicase n=1 Tax=Halomontanus rarus TaxID=3034020 RepID=UPI00293B8EA2|nr:DEAD/DEAH box helicase [Halovivax sp. KZCA124]
MPPIPDTISEEDKRLISDILEGKGFEGITQTQYEAFENGILDLDNHLLVAETGNGKTLCAEAITKKVTENGGRVAYLVPSTRLRTEKREGILEWCDDSLNVESGRYAYRNADIIVNTFDSFFQAMLHNSGNIRSVDQVILDDFHELYGDYRGPGLEKSIAAILDNEIPTFAMSATLGNPDELAAWFNAGLTISSEKRSTPIEEIPVEVEDTSRTRANYIYDIITKHEKKGPFLVFNESRNRAEDRLDRVAESGRFRGVSDTDFEKEVRQIVGDDLTDTHKHLIELMENGVAFHHAGLSVDLQDYIADCISDSEIIAISCTPTLAYGFDSPIQSVIVSNLKRYDGSMMAPIGVYEYVQWIGRAARAGYGYDSGYAFPIWSDSTCLELFQPELQTTEKTLEPVETHIENTKEFRILLLELIEYGWDTKELITDFIQNTLYWQQSVGTSPMPEELMRAETELLEMIEEGVQWLTKQDLVENPTVSESYSTSPTGEATLSFTHETWSAYPLRETCRFRKYLRENKIEPPILVEQAIECFDDVRFKQTSDLPEFEAFLGDVGLPNTDAGQGSAILLWYWCQGIDLESLEDDLDIDATYVGYVARDVGDIINASRELITTSPNTSVPNWYDALSDQLKLGAGPQLLTLIRNINGIGRNTARNTAEWLTEVDRGNETWDRDGETVLDDLHSLYHDEIGGDQTLFQDSLKDQVDGLGPKLSQRVVDVVVDWEPTGSTPVGVTSDMLDSGDFASRTDSGDRSDNIGKSHRRIRLSTSEGSGENTSLSDFT